MAENDGVTISAAMGRARTEVTKSFDFLIQIGNVGRWEFFDYLSPFKS
jgi:hypothetical protein